MPTRRRGQEPRKTVIRRTIIQEEPEIKEPHEQNWFRKNPITSIGIGLFIILLLFLPLCPVTKTVQTTETIYVPETTEEAAPATGARTIKVWQGYMWDAFGTPTTIDAVAGITDVRRSRGPNNTWVITTIDYNGNEVIYREIVRDDLTPTGSISVPATAAGTRTVTRQVPKQQTVEKQIRDRVSFWIYLLGQN